MRKMFVLAFKAHGPHCIRSILLERQNYYFLLWTLPSVNKYIVLSLCPATSSQYAFVIYKDISLSCSSYPSASLHGVLCIKVFVEIQWFFTITLSWKNKNYSSYVWIIWELMHWKQELKNTAEKSCKEGSVCFLILTFIVYTWTVWAQYLYILPRTGRRWICIGSIVFCHFSYVLVRQIGFFHYRDGFQCRRYYSLNRFRQKSQ